MILDLMTIRSVCGDTRFDRVIEIAEQFTSIPVIENLLVTIKQLLQAVPGRKMKKFYKNQLQRSMILH